jgi:hypothetical protein
MGSCLQVAISLGLSFLRRSPWMLSSLGCQLHDCVILGLRHMFPTPQERSLDARKYLLSTALCSVASVVTLGSQVTRVGFPLRRSV